ASIRLPTIAARGVTVAAPSLIPRCARDKLDHLHDAYAALHYKNFVWLLVSYALSTVAREAQIVVVGWQVYALTRDPLSLGLIGLAEALPLIAMALYAGHVADRVSRRTVTIMGTFAVLVSAVALFLFTTTGF